MSIRGLEAELADVHELRSQLAGLTIEYRDIDRQLYRSLLDLLPSGGVGMRFAREHVFENSYTFDHLEDLGAFLSDWQDADHTFHDKEVQAKLEGFTSASASFIAHLNTHAFPVRGTLRYKIYPDTDLDLATDDNRYAIEAVQQAEKLGTAVWQSHQELVRKARERLQL